MARQTSIDTHNGSAAFRPIHWLAGWKFFIYFLSGSQLELSDNVLHDATSLQGSLWDFLTSIRTRNRVSTKASVFSQSFYY